MLNKLKISKWTFWISLVFLVVGLIALSSSYTEKQYELAFKASWAVLYIGFFAAPVFVILIIIDGIFNDYSSRKMGLLSILINALLFCFACYIASHMFDNFMSLS